MHTSKLWTPSENDTVISIPASNVSYADQPLCLNPKIVPLTSNTKKKLQYFHSEHSAFDADKVAAISQNFKKHSHELLKSIEKQGCILDIEHITHQAESLVHGKQLDIELVICDLDNTTTDTPTHKKPIKVGHGLFLNSNVQQGQLLGIYSGTIEALNNNLIFSNDLGIKVTDSYRLNVSNRGAMTFIQSAPNKDLGKVDELLCQLAEFEELTDGLLTNNLETNNQKQRIIRQNEWQLLEARSITKQAIAGDNCLPIPIITNYQGNEIPLIAMVAKKDLPIGTQLLFDYGHEYFDALKIYPEYFLTDKKEGLILQHDDYLRPSYGVLRFPHLSYCPIGDWQIFFNSENNKSISIQFSDETLNITAEELHKELIRANMIN